MSERILINGAFRGQKITGQQRFATELSARLPYGEIEVPAEAQQSRLKAWAWAASLPVNPRVKEADSLLTLTSRGPIFSRKQILVVHDLFVLKNPEWYSYKYRATHIPILHSQIRSAKGIIGVSQPVLDEITSEFNLQIPTAVVPNAPAAIFTDPQQKDVALPAGCVSGQYLLSVASNDPRKNMARLLKAYMLNDLKWRREHPLVLCGGGDSTVFAQDSQVEVDETVIRLGYVSDDLLAVLYRHAERVVFPALDEGFGLPAVEALASGAKLLASDIPVFRWVCGDAAAYVDPYDIEAISTAMREPISTAAYDTDKFTWEKSAQTLVDYVKNNF